MGSKPDYEELFAYPLLDALRERRSRRFGLGMEMPGGPLAYRSAREPLPLSEEEEALLAFAACGFTGPALADLDFAPGGGGAILAGLQGRTVASGDAIQMVALFVTNADATYYLKRPCDCEPEERAELVELGRRGEFVDAYRRMRVRIREGRTAPTTEPLFNLAVNQWSLYDPAGTYFVPVNELTLLYVNGVLEIFGEATGAFVVDERAGFRPAGLARFARSKGGHLEDDPHRGRVLTIQQLESLLLEFTSVEQGMVMQNLALMTQALGLGGFPHWAAHPFGWLETLGFRSEPIRASRYAGMGRVRSALARLIGKDPEIPLAVGLEHDGHRLLAPYCPPAHASMADAVRAVVDLKFGPRGVFRGGVRGAAWREPEAVAKSTDGPSSAAVEATTAYCEYVWGRYGRFPAYPPPFRTVLGYQASHVDPDFYAKFYGDAGLSETQRRHMEKWHGG